MNETTGTRDYHLLLKKALLEIQGLRAQLEATRRRDKDPLAIVGMGCRFPGGATDPESFWRLLRDGVDAVGPVPTDRWNADAQYGPELVSPETIHTRRGGFLDRIDAFDPGFFAMSETEASAMDPQQRLLLEVAWEAFEHAGLPPDRVENSRTSVFLGITNMCDFYKGLRRPPQRSGTGISNCIAANRLSYFFGLNGPSLALDTACSSSMVALHLACQSLREGESDMALVAGVNAILSPDWMVSFSMAGMMSPDGLCKSFDASADGYVRAEGCAVLLLKRLEDAQRDGDRVLALVRGTATNQDGKSSGLTVPHGTAQREVIRGALENAGVSPDEISYVEAHGIGTEMGDPIEVAALIEVLSQGRSHDLACRIGSVKANIGHAEAASGLSGVVKAVLALQSGSIPPQLHLHTPNPLIDLEDSPFVIPTQLEPWPVGYPRRLVCVNSFGLGGTNAHAVLEAAPEKAQTTPGAAELPGRHGYLVLPLSAKTQPALRELARRYADYLASHPDAPLGEVCFTAGAGRMHFHHRVALVARRNQKALLHNQLQAFAETETPSDETAAPESPRIAFLFGGHSGDVSQAIGEPYRTHAVFLEALERCDRTLRSGGWLSGPPLAEQLAGAGHSQTAPPQPELGEAMLFARQYGILRVLDALGIVPAVLVGHGTGEYLAAHAAGVLSLEAALELAIRRGQSRPPAEGTAGDAPRRSWISGITGQTMPAHCPPDVAYWQRQIHEPVNEDTGLETLRAAGIDFVLVCGGREEVGGEAGACRWLPLVGKPAEAEGGILAETVASLYLGGAAIRWEAFDCGGRRLNGLPTYPFQRTRCWPGPSELKSYL